MKIKKRINQLNILKKELDRVFPKQYGDDKFKEDLKINFTFYSNRIEGNKLSYGETIRYLKEGLVSKSASIRDIADLKNHKEILDKIFEVYDTFNISVDTIKEIHKELMRDPEQWGGGIIDAIQGPGKYRQEEVGTETEEGYIEYISLFEVPEAMRTLVEDVNKQLMELDINTIDRHPLTIATRFHNGFMHIHPFRDGNGRTGRIFTNTILMKNGFSPMIIKDKKAYIRSIIKSENKNDIQPTLDYFCDVLSENIKKNIQYAINKNKMLNREIKKENNGDKGMMM